MKLIPFPALSHFISGKNPATPSRSFWTASSPSPSNVTNKNKTTSIPTTPKYYPKPLSPGAKNNYMKWMAISGSWRKTNRKVENDVRQEVKKIIDSGNGIVTGGALGVDFFATDEVIKLNPKLDKLKIFLPGTLDKYSAHYSARAKEGVISENQAKNLISQLNKVKKAIIENTESNEVNKDSYYKRNSKIIEFADELIAFQVNESEGVGDTISKAKQKGIPTKLFIYSIT